MSVQAFEFLKQAIAAARSGDKNQARRLLQQTLQLDPRNETAWLWSAGLAEQPRDALNCLERVLQLNPDNSKARQGLRQARLQAGINAVRSGEKNQARQWLRQSVEEEPSNEQAWLWLAGACEQPAEAIACLEKVLTLNPTNDRARAGLDYYKSRVAPRPAWTCGICNHADATKHNVCPDCGAMLSLMDVNAVLHNPHIDIEAIQKGLSRLLDQVRTNPDFTAYCYLGMGYLNLRQLAEAIHYFGEALQLQDHEGLRKQLSILDTHRAAQEGQYQAPPSVKPKRILVIDDSATIRKLVAVTMQRDGYDVIEAGDAAEALSRIETMGVPDLVLLDIVMPGMDGYQLCRNMRSNKTLAKLPIIMLSGKDGLFNKMRGKLAGSTLYLTKPFEPESLLKTIRKYCPHSLTSA
jgi:twitching motility two-component system response regulator PilG